MIYKKKHGLSLENQNKIRDLNQLEKKLQRDIKNEEKKIADLDKLAKQKGKKQAYVDKLQATYSAKVKKKEIKRKKDLTEQSPLTS